MYSFALGSPLKPLLKVVQKYKQPIDLQITIFWQKICAHAYYTYDILSHVSFFLHLVEKDKQFFKGDLDIYIIYSSLLNQLQKIIKYTTSINITRFLTETKN